MILLHNLAGQVLARADALPVADALAIQEDAAAQLFGERSAKLAEARSNPNGGTDVAVLCAE